MSSTRPQTRMKMIKERTDATGRVICDLCRQPIYGNCEMHELIPRRMTVGCDKARELSFQPELCVILCNPCHQVAEQNDVLLWERNYTRYGKDRVVSAFNRLWDMWPVTIKLPEVE